MSNLLDWIAAHPRQSALIGIWLSTISVVISLSALLMTIGLLLR